MQIVIEEQAVLAHGTIERLFARMTERRMAEVVHQRERLCQVYIEIERTGDGARDLCHLDGVREAVAEMVRIAAGEDLRLGFQAAKGAGVDDAIAVPLVIISIRMRRLREAASAGMF